VLVHGGGVVIEGRRGSKRALPDHHGIRALSRRKVRQHFLGFHEPIRPAAASALSCGTGITRFGASFTRRADFVDSPVTSYDSGACRLVGQVVCGTMSSRIGAEYTGRIRSPTSFSRPVDDL